MDGINRIGLDNQQAKDLTAELQIDGIPSIKQNQPADQQAIELIELLKSEQSKAGITVIAIAIMIVL